MFQLDNEVEQNHIDAPDRNAKQQLFLVFGEYLEWINSYKHTYILSSVVEALKARTACTGI